MSVIDCTFEHPIVIPALTGWSVERITPWDEDNCNVVLLISLHGCPTTVWVKHRLQVNNGMSSVIRFNPVSEGYYDMIVAEHPDGSEHSGISTPDGFTQLLNAWRQGETKEARQKALCDKLLELGIVDSTLFGTT